jgi:replicative DNA helicase
MKQNIKMILPHDEKNERVIIGSFLIDSGTAIEFASQIKIDMFFLTQCQEIYKCITSLINKGVTVDLVTVFQESRALKLNIDINFLNECTYEVNNTVNLPFYIVTLKEMYIRRQLVLQAQKMLNKATNLHESAFDLIANVQTDLMNSVDALTTKKADTLAHLSQERVNYLIENNFKKDNLNGIKSGFKDVDDVLGGCLLNSALIIIAGRPAMGKTTLALNIAINTSMLYGNSGAIFSLEMSKQQLTDKFLASESEVDSRLILRNTLHDLDIKPLKDATLRLQNSNIFIDDSSTLTPLTLRSKATNLKVKHDIKFIIVDYIQLMNDDNAKGKSREQIVSEISRTLKSIAMDLNIPVIALSQLSRDVEKRGNDKRPKLSDLRESGAIEQDADVVIFPYRPEYYGIEVDEQGNSLKNTAEIIIEKNRFGDPTFVNVGCDLSKSKFFDLHRVNDNTKINNFPNVTHNFEQEYLF